MTDDAPSEDVRAVLHDALMEHTPDNVSAIRVGRVLDAVMPMVEHVGWWQAPGDGSVEGTFLYRDETGPVHAEPTEWQPVFRLVPGA